MYVASMAMAPWYDAAARFAAPDLSRSSPCFFRFWAAGFCARASPMLYIPTSSTTNSIRFMRHLGGGLDYCGCYHTHSPCELISNSVQKYLDFIPKSLLSPPHL